MYLTRVFKSLRCCVLIGEYSTRFFMILDIAADESAIRMVL